MQEYQGEGSFKIHGPEVWVPDIMDRDQLFLAWHKRFHWFMDMEAFEKALDYVYIQETFVYGDSQQKITYKGPRGQWTDIMEHELEIVLQTFGPRKLDPSEKSQLAASLGNLRKGHERREGEMKERNVEMPQVFERQPEVVRFLLREYFGQLPFGERQALLNEFEAESGHLTGPEAIRRTFELTGTEKIGQFLSVRRDLLPPEYCEELKKFQENVEGTPFEEIRDTIATELGRPLWEIFQEVNPVPLNIGTIGQVHEARLLSGERVVVKVIPPSKRRVVSQMLERMQKVCQQLEKNKDRFPGAYDPMGMYKEFKVSMDEELDFRNEFRNAESLRGTMGKGISTPRYYEQFVGRSVVVQSFVEGIKVSEIPNLKTRQKAVADIGEMLMDQILETGEFHDDLHPGNIRFVVQSGEKVVLDYGRVGKLEQGEREALIPLLMAIRGKSPDEVLRVLEPISKASDRFDRIGLRKEFERIMTSEGKDAAAMISDLFTASADRGMVVTPAYLRVLKAVMTFEGTAQEADPKFELQTFLQTVILKKKLGGGVGSLLSRFMK